MNNLKFTSRLPELPVLRETYCSQTTVNELIAFVEKNRPDILEAMKSGIETGDGDIVRDAQIELKNYLNENKSSAMVPSTKLGRLDFTFELKRRIRRSLNLPDATILGNPLILPLGDIQHKIQVSRDAEAVGINPYIVAHTLTRLAEVKPEILQEFSEATRLSLMTGSESLADLAFFIKEYCQNEPLLALEKRAQERIFAHLLLSEVAWAVLAILNISIKRSL